MNTYMPFRETTRKKRGYHRWLLIQNGMPLKSPPHPTFGTAEAAMCYADLLENAPTEAAFIREFANEFEGGLLV